MLEIPMIGRKYEVTFGPYKGFIGECVSYDLENNLEVILQDENFNPRAVKATEIKLLEKINSDISREQQN